MKTYGKLSRHQRRLTGLPWSQKMYYVISTLFGETFSSRGVGGLGLRLVEIAVTDRCQCRCVHCYAATDQVVPRKDELATTEIMGILDQAAALHATEICFSGGEPLLREDLVEMVRYARRKRMTPKINTNGLLLEDKRIVSLKEAGLAWCSVSIDSPRAADHDRLRRSDGCFDRAVAGIQALIRLGVPASITTYARKEAVYEDDLEGIVALGHELGVETVRILFPVPMGRFEQARGQMLVREEREHVRRLLKDPIVTMESPHEGSRCRAAITKVNIMANGDVAPCVFVPFPYGNIRQTGFKELWERMAEFDRMHKPTGMCPMSDARFRDSFYASKEARETSGTAAGETTV